MTYIDHSFGFPVYVQNATLIDFDGEQALKINQNHFDTLVLHALVTKEGRFSGAEIKYMMSKLQESTHSFAKKLGVTQPAVMKWRKENDDTAKIHWTTEKVIRMEIFSKQLKNHVAYTMDELFDYLEQVPPQVVKPVIVDAKQTQILLKSLAVL